MLYATFIDFGSGYATTTLTQAGLLFTDFIPMLTPIITIVGAGIALAIVLKVVWK